MSDRSFRRTWYSGMGIATLIVGVVATLLIAIISVASSILKNATHALGIAQEIVSNTQPVWELDTTNAVVSQILGGARSIEQHATQIADVLEAPQPAAK